MLRDQSAKERPCSGGIEFLWPCTGKFGRLSGVLEVGQIYISATLMTAVRPKGAASDLAHIRNHHALAARILLLNHSQRMHETINRLSRSKRESFIAYDPAGSAGHELTIDEATLIWTVLRARRPFRIILPNDQFGSVFGPGKVDSRVQLSELRGS